MNKTENQILKIILILVVIIGAIIMFIWKPDEPFKILALLGALSWVILISDLIMRVFIRPTIKIIPGKKLELGFNNLGPIINNEIALLSNNKPALIENIEVELTHENNTSYIFNWQWFEEQLYEMLSHDSSQNINARKNQKATALKIESDEMIEKKIGFQQSKHLSEYDNNIQKVNKKYVNISNNDPSNIQSLKTSNEYNDLKQFSENSFIWKKGNYQIEYKVYVMGIKTPFTLSQSFELSDLDISTLKINIDYVKKGFDITYKMLKEEYPNYHWIYAPTK